MSQNRKSKNVDASMIVARRAAFEVLRNVIFKKRALDDAFGFIPQYMALTGADRGFASYIVRTALRRLGQIDALIDHCVPDSLPRKARPVRDVLRIGITQLLFSATAPHAAVSTTVDLCRDVEQVPFAKLVNAVMRRIQREGAQLLEAQDPARLNTSDWLWDSWVSAYGEETARAIAAVHLETPPLDLTPKSDPEMWAEQLGGTVILDGTVRLSEASDVTMLDGFEDGHWWVQDAAARLAVILLGDLQDKHVIDLCAAPGGKTMELLSLGASVTAVDISERRMGRVRENLQRTGYPATLVTEDARTWEPNTLADIVLLDAPCSSTGTLRRHPDIAHLKSMDDVTKLSGIQDQLLDRAAVYIKPGGMLMFVTCSLQPQEGLERVTAFLDRHTDFARVGIQKAELPGLEDAITPDGDLQTLPHLLGDQGGMDGFFVARLVKTTHNLLPLN